MATVRGRNERKWIIARLAWHFEYEDFMKLSDKYKKFGTNHTPQSYFDKAEKILYPRG